MKLDFARRLNQLMAERKMTVRAAAQHAKVATSTVQNWRSGHIPSDFMAVKRLADALAVSFSFLLTGEEDMHSSTRQPSVSECFSFDEMIFDGYARLTIQKMYPLQDIGKGSRDSRGNL